MQFIFFFTAAAAAPPLSLTILAVIWSVRVRRPLCPTDRPTETPPRRRPFLCFSIFRDRERQGERGRWHQNGYPARSTSCATGKMHTSRPSSGDDRAIRGNKRPDAIPSHPTVIGPRRRRLPCHSARVAANLAVHGALTMMWNARVSTKDKIKCNSLSF